MKILNLDHVALPVADLELSCDFYEQTLNLEPMQRPNFSFPGAWYRLGETRELHLLARGTEAGTHKDRHFALAVEDIEAAAAHLDSRDAEYTGPKQRPDGVWQIFLQDPDGHFIELCSPHRGDRRSPAEPGSL